MNRNRSLIQLSESDKIKFGSEGFDFASQSQPQKVFSAIWLVEAEVNNGGFWQYFTNDSAESAPFMVEALNTIGAPKTADICQRAIFVAFPAGLPKTGEEIRTAAANFADETLQKLETLTQEFFAYPHDLTELLFDFVVKYPEEFGNLPEA